MQRLYNQKALSNAKILRQNQTDCEYIMWQNLRGRRLNNIKFRRQIPIGKYIADFLNLEKKLIIELDGSQHLDDKQIEYDNLRIEFLIQLGYKVLRFNNNDIMNNLETVLNVIAKEYDNL